VAAAGAGGKKEDEEVDPEVAHEQRVQMAKKGRMANKTYQKGNIALMRRIHMHNLDDDGVRALLPTRLPVAAVRGHVGWPC
jgi:hypothetical protein